MLCFSHHLAYVVLDLLLRVLYGFSSIITSRVRVVITWPSQTCQCCSFQSVCSCCSYWFSDNNHQHRVGCRSESVQRHQELSHLPVSDSARDDQHLLPLPSPEAQPRRHMSVVCEERPQKALYLVEIRSDRTPVWPVRPCSQKYQRIARRDEEEHSAGDSRWCISCHTGQSSLGDLGLRASKWFAKTKSRQWQWQGDWRSSLKICKFLSLFVLARGETDIRYTEETF